MNARLQWSIGVVAVVIAAIVFFAYFNGGAHQGAGPSSLQGSVAPSFAVVDTAGKQASLADYRGKIVVMNLWASWCPPCRAEMPDLERLHQTERAHGVVVLGVNQGEGPERAASFARSLGITYPVLVDEGQQYGRVYAALGLPTTIVIDRNGVVARGFDGALTYDQMRDAVAPLIGAR